MFVTLASGKKVECDDQHFAEGGEGFLYWDKAGTHVIKLYKQVDPLREAALQKIIGRDFSVVLNDSYWDDLFCWPKEIIQQPSLGLTMLRAPKGAEELRWFLEPKARQVLAQRSNPDKLGEWTNYLSLAILMARVVRRMHFRGLCHSDLSFRNFLVDPPQNRVVLIDCDSLVVPGFLPPKVIGTQKCMAPELMAQFTSPGNAVDPSPHTDLHALATLIYWLLFRRHPLEGPKVHVRDDPALDDALALGERALFIEHPTDKSNRPANLPIPYQSLLTPAVQELVKQAFVTGLHHPAKRPSAADWERFLVRMTDSMVRCQNSKCQLGAFVLQPQSPARCPACGTALTNPGHLPILNFYRPRKGRQGHFQNDQGYIMVGTHGRTLHTWHADATQVGHTADQNPKGALEFDHRRGKWYFRNLDFGEIRLLNDVGGQQSIGPGKLAELTNGARLLFGPSDQCRLAYVQMLALQ